MTTFTLRAPCGHRVRVRLEHAGKQVRCPTTGCARAFRVPSREALLASLAPKPGDVLSLSSPDPDGPGGEQTLDSLPQAPGPAPAPAPPAPRPAGPGGEQTLDSLPQAPGPAPAPAPLAPRPAVPPLPGGLWRPGEVVDGRYEVRRKLGEGTFGSVWHAWHRDWQIDLAVKELRQDRGVTPQRRQSFLREAEAWVDLGLHPHVVTAWYAREVEGIPYLFLEYCPGGSLASWVEGGKTRDLPLALDVGIQLCRGLQHCHAKGVVHRDFKPLNVLMTRDGTAKLTDFGTVKFAALGDDVAGEVTDAVRDLRKTLGGHLQGTPPYMPAEQWVRGGAVDPRADLYALGVTLFEMLTGDFPVRPAEKTLAAWAAAHAHSDPANVRAARPDVPELLARLIGQCLAKRPEERPAGAVELGRGLAEVYREVTGKAYARPEPRELALLADSLNNKALSLSDLGLRAEAEREWAKALDVDPRHPEATYNLGLCLWRTGRMDDLTLVNRMREVCTGQTDRWIPAWLLAQVSLERGDHAAVAEALALVPENEREREEVAAARAAMTAREPDARRLVRKITSHEMHMSTTGGPVLGADLSADGRRAVSCGEDIVLTRSTRSLKVWDVETGACLRTLPVSLRGSVCLSPDGKRVFGMDWSDQAIKSWDIDTGELVKTFAPQPDQLSVAGLTADGRQFLSRGLLCARLWDVETGQCLRELPRDRQNLTAACVSPDGRHVAAGEGESGPRFYRVLIWDAVSGQLRPGPAAHQGPVLDVRFLPDGRHVLSVEADGTGKVWDAGTGQCLRTVPNLPKGPFRISPDGEYAVSATGNTLHVWRVATGQILWSTASTDYSGLNPTRFSDDGRFFLTYGQGNVKLWQVGCHVPAYVAPPVLCRPVASEATASVQESFGERLAEARGVLDVDPVAASRSIRQARELPGCRQRPEALELWLGLYSRLPRRTLAGGWEVATLQGHENEVVSLCLSPDGTYVLSASGRGWFSNDSHPVGSVRLWDVASRRCLHVLAQGSSTAAAFSADGRTALTTTNGQVSLWDVASGKQTATFRGPGAVACGASLSSDGQLVLVSFPGNKHVFQLHEAQTGRTLRQWTTWAPQVLQLSPDDQYALCGGHEIYDVVTGRCVRRFKIYACKAGCISRDGRHVLTGRENTVHLWDVRKEESLQAMTGHGKLVTCVAMTTDGRFGFSGSEDKTIKAWDLATGECLRTFEGHAGWVLSLSVSEDGRWLASGGQDGTIKLWLLDWDLEEKARASWDEGARPFLETFLTRRTPRAADTLVRGGKPTWGDQEFRQLLRTLASAGYGWLRPDGVGRELENMAATWTGPRALPGEAKEGTS